MNDELKSPGLARLREVLDDSAAGFDAATLSRLNRARQAALASRVTRRRYALPIGLALAASLLFAVMVLRPRTDPMTAPLAGAAPPTSAHAETPAPAPASMPAPRADALAHEPTPALAHEMVQPVIGDDAIADPADDFLADLPEGDAAVDTDELAQDLEFYAWLDAQEAQDG